MGTSIFRALQHVLNEPTPLAMVLLASLTVHVSTWRACCTPSARADATKEGDGGGQGSRIVHDDPLELGDVLTGPMLLALPVAVGLVLLVMFWFGDIIGPLLIILASIVGVVTISFVLWPVVGRLGVGVAVQRSLLGLLAGSVVVVWLLTGSWIANDILAASLCITAVSVLRIHSLKSITQLGIGLVVYDVFMVFITPYFSKEGKSVMVEVATSEPKNPVATLTEALNLPTPAATKLGFPGKLILPVLAKDSEGSFAILGLGDCLLPALLFVFLRTIENMPELDSQRKRWMSYYWCGLAAYASSVLLSYVCNIVSGVAQPALLYIMPATLVTTVILSRKNGELMFLWDPTSNPVQASGDEERPLTTVVLDGE